MAALARAHPKIIEQARTGLLADIAAAKHAPPPPVEHWAIAEPYAGIEHAQLVIVNVRNDTERRAGERIVADLMRLRKDEALFNDILGLRGTRVPITAVTANLADPGDPGRKKALARVRRALRSGSS